MDQSTLFSFEKIETCLDPLKNILLFIRITCQNAFRVSDYFWYLLIRLTNMP